MNACKISPTNMRASADIIWRTFQTFNENDELDSLASEEEDEELSSEDFESGEEEGEGTDSRTFPSKPDGIRQSVNP